MNESDDIECPACQGTGKVKLPKRKRKELKQSIIKKLIAEGWSMREIAKEMGYKSANSISQFLKH